MRTQPKGRVLQKNLDTHYVRLDGILQSLGREAFSGYVRCVFEQDEGAIFFRDGDLVAAIFERGGTLSKGLPALEQMAADLRVGRAFLDLCQLDHDLLAALLAVWHGQQLTLEAADRPASVAAAAGLLRARNITGALVAESPAGEVLGYAADGEILGWHLAGPDEWSRDMAAFPPDLTGWRIHHAANAQALRTVDLNKQKDRIMNGLLRIVSGQIPHFGARLFTVECDAQEMTDPHRLTKMEFERLTTGIAARARLLVGEQRAETMRTSMRDQLTELIDLGI